MKRFRQALKDGDREVGDEDDVWVLLVSIQTHGATVQLNTGVLLLVCLYRWGFVDVVGVQYRSHPSHASI